MEEQMEKNTSSTPDRKFKDGMFRAIFKDPDRFRELTNAALGTDFGPDTPMEETTLSSALYIDYKNDVSFLVDGRLIVFTEHQTTITPNIALRFLVYAADTYKARFDAKSMHSSRRLTIPRPYFFVIYNGTRKAPPTQTVRLSEMFAEWPGPGDAPFSLDLEAAIYNINTNSDPEILHRCETLAQYETFVELSREYEKKYGRDRAIQLAIDECVKRGILTNFLTIHGAEVRNMIYTEVTIEELKEIYRENAREEVREEVKEEVREEVKEEVREAERERVISLIEQGFSLDEIKRMLS